MTQPQPNMSPSTAPPQTGKHHLGKPHEKSRRNKKRKTDYQCKPKVLLVGDSIAHNTNFNCIEVVTNTTLKTAKAYSSAWDNSARFKAQNIKDVTKNELMQSSYDHVLLAAPTVDISNLNTGNMKAADNVEALKKKVEISCKNMMKVAEDALVSHNNLKKVTIMNHAPRFDTAEMDPIGLKQNLANFANNYMLELWLDCPMKDKIVISSHNLECSGEQRIKRYTDDRTKRYDGVHLYGSAGKVAYTESVLNIMLGSLQPQTKADDHTRCPQSNYSKQQRTYSSVVKGKSGIKIQNKFSPLGNC